MIYLKHHVTATFCHFCSYILWLRDLPVVCFERNAINRGRFPSTVWRSFCLAEKPGTNVAKDMKEERDGSLGRRNGKWYPAARLELVNNFRPSTRVVSHFELKEILTRRKWKKCKTIEMDKCSHAYKSSNTLQGCCFCENKKLRNCTSKLV